jgi:hypothetical protein
MLLVGWILTTYQLTYSDQGTLSFPQDEMSFEEKAEWRELPISEKIPKLSGAVLLRFKEEDNQFMAAYVDSIYTNDSAVKIPLKIGDRVEKEDYYAKGGYSSNRDGIVLMYIGITPREIQGAYLYDNRLVGEQDMPLALFLEKFEKSK